MMLRVELGDWNSVVRIEEFRSRVEALMFGI